MCQVQAALHLPALPLQSYTCMHDGLQELQITNFAQTKLHGRVVGHCTPSTQRSWLPKLLLLLLLLLFSACSAA
jgi:hypothetical protein